LLRRFDVPICAASAYPSGCDKLTRRAKFRFTETPNQVSISAIPFRQEGRSAVVTNAGWDVVDASASARMASQGEMNLVSDWQARRTNDALAYEQNRVVLTPVAGAKSAVATQTRPGLRRRKSRRRR
jgi:hypothetical protein